jgi:hypothetical protein
LSAPRSPTPEQRLLQAVILTAIADASGRASGRPTGDAGNKRRALAWFNDAGSDFREVCEGAGLHPDTVRKFALAFIASGEPFPSIRRTNGRGGPGSINPLSQAAIAAHAGVSPAAVQGVLNYDRGSPAMKARVRQAMREITEQQALAA